VNRKLSRIPFFIVGLFLLYQGFYDIINTEILADTLRHITFLPFLFKGVLLILIPGLKLILGLILLFLYKQREPAALIAFLVLLVMLTYSIYFALTVNLCGTCGELKKNIVLLNVWGYVGINFLALCMNALGIFISADDINND
jgi:hypothetical protein